MRRILIALALGALGAATVVQTVVADGWQGDDGVIGAGASSTPGDPAASITDEPVVCVWDDDAIYSESQSYARGQSIFVFADSRLWRFSLSTGEAWVRAHRICRQAGEVVSSSLEWRRVVAPDPRIIAEGLYDEVVRQVPLPEPALSPAGPGFVNLGMWLAVTEPDPISVTATAGVVWATTSAELVTTSFDMGDGTVVTCDGAGDPIPSWGLESLEPSPVCGHTYTSVNGREPFAVTITSTWRVSWVGSGGMGGDLGELELSTSLAYRVLEIQTVGS